MSLTSSKMLPLGTKAPDFKLIDTRFNELVSYSQVKGRLGTVIMFICNHCPYVLHVNEEMVRIANDYRVAGFGFAAISSNDIEKYPQDAPDLMKQVADENNYTFPYLYDVDQSVAKSYDAACTPDFYLFDREDKLIYRGQLDNSRPGNSIPLTGRSLREAMDSVLGNRAVTKLQKPSLGCNIKWK